MFMRTHRLFLRPAWPEDRAEHGCALPFGAQRTGSEEPHPRFPHWLVTRPDASGGAASIGQLWLEADGDAAQVRCHIAPIQRRRGYGAEALCGLVAMAQMLGHTRLVANPGGDDPSLARMLARAGFRRAGAGRWQLDLADGVPMGTAA